MPKHLMGAQEIERRLGVSRQRVYVLTQRPDWPEPYDVLAMGKVWRVEDVEAWIQEHRPDLANLAADDLQEGPALAESDGPGRSGPASLDEVLNELEKLRSRVESLEIDRESLGESP